jgi:hypothetical protein
VQETPTGEDITLPSPDPAVLTAIVFVGWAPTATVAVPVRPPVNAVIVVVPGRIPVTITDFVALTTTVATEASLEVALSSRIGNEPPCASLTCTASSLDSPTATVEFSGAIVTVAGGPPVTVTWVVPNTLGFAVLVALIVAVPAEIPTTAPNGLTVATAMLSVLQATVVAAPAGSPNTAAES